MLRRFSLSSTKWKRVRSSIASAMKPDRYNRESKIAQGKYGEVFLCRDKKSDEQVVEKIIYLENLSLNVREAVYIAQQVIENCGICGHPNVVCYLKVARTTEALYILSEYCEGGNLRMRLNEHKATVQLYDESTILLYIGQMAAGLDYLHTQKIIHCNLKPENVLINSHGQLKISDFGVSAILNNSFPYTAPEVIKEQQFNRLCDIWSLGVITFELAMLRLPFDVNSAKELKEKIASDFQPTISDEYTVEFERLLLSMMNVEVSLRPEAWDIMRLEFIRRTYQDPNFSLPELDRRRSSELYYAASLGQCDTIALLAQIGVNLDSKEENGFTPLHGAAMCGRCDAVEALARHGTSLNPVTFAGQTPLHVAAEQGCAKVVELLLTLGADVHARTWLGDYALHIAAAKGYFRGEHNVGGQESRVNVVMNSTFFAPVEMRHATERAETMTKLLDYGAAIDALNRDGCTALHLAAERDHCDALEVLIKRNAELNLTDAEGHTALHLAAWNGHRAAVKLLLSIGVQMNKVTAVGYTALHVAAQNGHRGVVETLIQHGSDANAVDCQGWTSLHCASFRGHRDVIEYLLGAGSSVNAPTQNGFTPLHLCAQNGLCSAIELLLNNRASVNACTNQGNSALHLIASRGLTDALMTVIHREADIEATNSLGCTSLHLAAHSGHLTVVDALISNGAQTSTRTSMKCTPLHLAAHNGHLTVAETLINSGADISAVQMHDATPIHLAAMNGHADVVRLLVEHGENVNRQEVNGYTALHLAVENNHPNTVSMLLSLGADINVCTAAGSSPFVLAVQTGHWDIADILSKMAPASAEDIDTSIPRRNTLNSFIIRL